MKLPVKNGETRWWWVRHAPVIGHGGKIYGQLDVACDTSDRASFEALAKTLPGDAVWVTSGLKRTTETAGAVIAAGDFGAPEILVEPEFVEQSFGDWQGNLSWDEVHAADQGLAATFWDDPANNAPPGGESFAQQMARVGAAIERLSATHAGRDIIAVTHGGTIRAAVGLALGTAAENVVGIHLANLSLTRLDHFIGNPISAWRVAGVNLPPGAVPIG